MSQDTTAKRKTVKGEPPTHRGLQMSELEAPNTHLQRSTKRCSRGFGRRGKWSIGAPGGAGTDDGCRFGAVSEFGRRIDADHLLGTCVAHRVALCQRASPNRPCVSFPLCAFFGGGRFVGPLRWLIDHRQTMESCSLNRLPLRFHIPDSRGSRVVFVLFSCCSLGHEGQLMADCNVWKKQKEFFPSQFLLLFSSVLVLVV